jgi:hypothetical protein
VNISNCTKLETHATASAPLGDPISDTATLSGATSAAGGTLTFHLFPSLADCRVGTNEIATRLNPVPVNGNGDYNSGNFTPTATGTYFWAANYSGDDKNLRPRQGAATPASRARSRPPSRALPLRSNSSRRTR